MALVVEITFPVGQALVIVRPNVPVRVEIGEWIVNRDEAVHCCGSAVGQVHPGVVVEGEIGIAVANVEVAELDSPKPVRVNEVDGVVVVEPIEVAVSKFANGIPIWPFSPTRCGAVATTPQTGREH
ncbi:MAG: hypothetical protein BWX44_01406 [Spirochaetes bacterium ADurb.Bin001]|nr:MAG: hypothetical protein BWX44_01406 [Spirochaetes bacterium ADurb.Bin001]